MTVDVSVIVPVYNAGGYLKTCLDSIVAQTYDHAKMEVLLVDDGSDDGSEVVCDQYAAGYPGLFRVIHCEHTGSPGAARNVGMRQAVGEYILFSDADDWWGSEAVERLLFHARKWGSDMVQGRLCNVENGKIKGINKYFDSNRASMPCADWRSFQQLTSTLGTIRLFKRSVTLENDIWWDDESWFEDTLFSLKLIFASEVCSVANDYNYYYVRRSDDNQSLSTSQKTPTYIKRPENIVGSIEKLFDLYDSQGVTPEEGHYLLCKLLRHQVITGAEIVIEQVGLGPDAYAQGAAPFLRQIWGRAARYYTEDVKKGLSLEARCALEGLAVGMSLDDLKPLRCVASCGRLPKEVKRSDACGDASLAREEGLDFLSASTFEELLLRQLSNVVFGKIHHLALDGDDVLVSGDVFFPLMGSRDARVQVVLVGEGGRELSLGPADLDFECHGEQFQGRAMWLVRAPASDVLGGLAVGSGPWDIRFDVSLGSLSRSVTHSGQKLENVWRNADDTYGSIMRDAVWCGLLPSGRGVRMECVDLLKALDTAVVTFDPKKKSTLVVEFPFAEIAPERQLGFGLSAVLVDDGGKPRHKAPLTRVKGKEGFSARLAFGDLLRNRVLDNGEYSIRLDLKDGTDMVGSRYLRLAENNPAHFVEGGDMLMSGKNKKGAAVIRVAKASGLRRLRLR